MVKITKTNPPVPLTPEQVYLYKYIVKYLASNNAFSDIDGLTVAEAVKCYFRLSKFEKDADNNGWVQTFENGTNLSSEAVLYYKEEKRWADFCKVLGLHVKARDTIKVFKADDGGQKGFIRQLTAMRNKAANG